MAAPALPARTARAGSAAAPRLSPCPASARQCVRTAGSTVVREWSAS